jgi:hypothetical protein
MNDITTTLRALAISLNERAEFGFDSDLKVTLAGRQALVQDVVAIAHEVDALADEANVRDIDRREFSGLMERLHSLGKRPPTRLVNAVERAIATAAVRRMIHRSST